MDKLNLDQHISRQFNEDLEEIKTSMLEMGGLVEKQVGDAIRALEDADSGLAERVIEVESQIDEMEMDIETPRREYREKEEVNSTGCKSFNGKTLEGKKSRPKDKGLRGLSSKAFRVVL